MLEIPTKSIEFGISTLLVPPGTCLRGFLYSVPPDELGAISRDSDD